MKATTHRVGEQRPGGRAARVRTSVLEAVLDLLNEEGYERLTFERVASRAGVHKTTVYRRWPSKAELVLDAVRVDSAQNVPVPDTGTLGGDLYELAQSVVSNIGTEPRGHVTRSIVAASMASEELAASMHSFWAERFDAMAPIIERAADRGELPASSDPRLIIETVIGPMWIRLLLTGGPIDDDLANRVSRLVANLVQS